MLNRNWWRFGIMGVALIGIGGGVQPGEGWAQPHGMERARPGTPPGHMFSQACGAAFEANLGEGRGFGMAFVADQNGYPGPLHALELKDQLKLTPDQEAKVQTLLSAMFAEAQPKGQQLLAAERKLRQVFADRVADEASVRTAVAEVERARSEVRVVHLLFHLRTREILTEDQRRVYRDARWSQTEPTSGHGGSVTK